ncbi:hypothetical protein EXIGLDRAFT_828625 [Exidia glandulosa HHB12029]|uniref:BTB domain-containing protein n=1 Tax=Exidia glandulosa HHB12029 TaxID=1314781 RepID=A0A165Q918_EXIGL|nr:hypothetical protein EXIGLDRAFT_828625 [Exidia glandulosa HHB12029]
MTSSVPAPEISYHADFATDGDIELATPANVHFRIASSTLCRSSSFFRAMFANAQPDSSTSERHVVVVDEDEQTVEVLLKIASGLPVQFLQLTEMEDVERLAHAADKYDMPAALNFLQVYMHVPAVRAQPLRRYALAARYGWEDSCAEALVDTLQLDIDFSPGALPPMDMLHLARILRLRQFRIKAFAAVLDDVVLFGFGNSGKCNAQHVLPKPTPWDTLKAFLVLELTRHPCGTTVLSANHAVLEAAREAKCKECENGTLLYHWPRTLDLLQRALQRLPTKLD